MQKAGGTKSNVTLKTSQSIGDVIVSNFSIKTSSQALVIVTVGLLEESPAQVPTTLHFTSFQRE